MIAEYPIQIALWISEKDKQKIDELLKQGKFKTRSELIRAALSKFLSEN